MPNPNTRKWTTAEMAKIHSQVKSGVPRNKIMKSVNAGWSTIEKLLWSDSYKNFVNNTKPTTKAADISNGYTVTVKNGGASSFQFHTNDSQLIMGLVASLGMSVVGATEKRA